MSKTWLITSIISGALGAILSFWIFENLLISFIIFVVIFIIILKFSPHRRYMSAFWVLLSTLVFLNKYSIEIIGNLMNIKFQIKSDAISNSVSALLVILCITSLILDFLERKKTKGNLITTKKTSIKNKGDSFYSEGDMSITGKNKS